MKARLSCVLALLALACLAFQGLAASPTARKKFAFSSARNATIPLFREGESKPYATVRFEVLKTDRQKRGFFKIGILPLVVIQGVDLEVAQAADLGVAFRELPNLLNALPQDGLKLKDFRLRARGQAQPLLEAAEATVAGLSDFVILREVRLGSAPEKVVTDARLELSGANSGALRVGNDLLQIFQPIRTK